MKFILIVSVAFLLFSVHLTDAHGKKPAHGKGEHHPGHPHHGKGDHPKHPFPPFHPGTTEEPSTEEPETEGPETEEPLTEGPIEPATTEAPLTEEPLTEPPEETTAEPPVHGVCPRTCRHTFCKKGIAFSYEVTGVKEESDAKMIYQVKIINRYKGLPSDLKETTLEVPKSNKKHKIKTNDQFLFMCSGDLKGQLVLSSGCFNKQLSLLSFIEQAFLNSKPNEFCEKRKRKGECRVKKCVKKCCSFCQDCDDEGTCEEDCKTRCQQVSWFNRYKSSARESRRFVRFV